MGYKTEIKQDCGCWEVSAATLAQNEASCSLLHFALSGTVCPMGRVGLFP